MGHSGGEGFYNRHRRQPESSFGGETMKNIPFVTDCVTFEPGGVFIRRRLRPRRKQIKAAIAWFAAQESFQ
jgi:hypothetical protein